MQRVIVKPILSEKSLQEGKRGRYTFVVARDADKRQIKNAVETMFGVSVEKVFTSTIKGTRTRVSRRGKRVSDLSYKKARVALKRGEKIEMLEEGGETKS